MAFTVRATAIVPKGFDAGRIRREVEYVLEKEGIDDRATFKKTIEGWKGTKPTMGYETKVTSKEASVWIGPDGGDVDKWTRIDEGTEEHVIAARNAPTLKFPFQGKGRSYNPKTRSTWLGSVPGAGQKFGPIITPKSVLHPGTEPRYWSKTLAARRIGPFASNVQAAIARGMA